MITNIKNIEVIKNANTNHIKTAAHRGNDGTEKNIILANDNPIVGAITSYLTSATTTDRKIEIAVTPNNVSPEIIQA